MTEFNVDESRDGRGENWVSAEQRNEAGGNVGQIIPPKLYRIGEVVQHSGFSRQTIHNYTVMGLIRESRWTDGGHRLYGPEVFETLAEIRRLKSSLPLGQIKRLLASRVQQNAVAG